MSKNAHEPQNTGGFTTALISRVSVHVSTCVNIYTIQFFLSSTQMPPMLEMQIEKEFSKSEALCANPMNAP